jgi:predicted deacetylase
MRSVGPSPTSRDANLLVSIHDVSPLTWTNAAAAVELTGECGVPVEALTLLVVPRHESAATLAGSQPFVDWLRGLADRGATLVAHGLTHRMRRPAWAPHRALWAYLFAAGQGEFYTATRDESRRWLAEIREAFSAVGLGEALTGFVPPAWLLSPPAREEVLGAGFEFVETMGGIHVGERLLARRLIGWGSRVGIEALGTAIYARVQAARPLADTRVAIHPPDMVSKICRRSITRVLGRLVPRTRLRGYREFVRAAAA